jgi:UDP-N-acetylmuramoyl-tripeptide--D-alanyl-D-alanine ligase
VEPRSLKFVAAACAAEIRRGDGEAIVKNVSTDSRSVKAGDLFFALKGDRFDGHDYLDEVAAKHVAAVVVERARADGAGFKAPGQVAILVVGDVRAALGKLAEAYRGQFDLPLIAVAGSNGKTTTKELLASVLRTKFSTLWSEASFNNDIGVPMTLLRLDRTHQAAVLEAGTNHPGELAPLVRMIRPQYGVLTNIGREHLEFFGDIGGVAQEEGMLAELLPPDGKLFLNGDNEWSAGIAKRTRAQVIRVGFDDGNDWRARKSRLDKNGVTFQVEAPKAGLSGEYRVNLLQSAMN